MARSTIQRLQGKRRFRFPSRPGLPRVEVNIKRHFFNTPLVENHFRAMRRDVRRYRHYAGYLRRVARNSIRQVRAKRYGKAWRKPSPKFSPPRSRDPRKLMKKIEFGWDTKEDAMIVGPYGFHKTGNTTVPSIHEKAKTVIVTRNVYAPRQRARSARQAQAYRRKLRDGKIKPRTPIGTTSTPKKYPPRPFMWPAAKKTKDKFPRMWAKAVLG